MALTTLALYKTFQNITSSDLDTQLTALVTAADAAIKVYLRRGRHKTAFTSWPESGADTLYMSGNGMRDLIFPYWPITTLTSVYLDQTGYYGDGTSAFASGTLLTVGTDYVLVKDDGTATSTSAKIRRLGGLSSSQTGGDWGWYPSDNYGYGSRNLYARKGPVWPIGSGNLKISATTGFSSVPADLQAACNQLVRYLQMTAQLGGMRMNSEALGSYNYSLAQMAIGQAPELGSTRQLLAAYRERLP